jgi:Rrf2 family protein
MLKLSKKADYSVQALMHMAAMPDGEAASARQIAVERGIPAELTAKLLQALARGGLCRSRQGARGGYELARRPERISLGEVLAAVDGPPALAECLDGNGGPCPHHPKCELSQPLNRVQDRLDRFFADITLAELLQ